METFEPAACCVAPKEREEINSNDAHMTEHTCRMISSMIRMVRLHSTIASNTFLHIHPSQI